MLCIAEKLANASFSFFIYIINGRHPTPFLFLFT